MGNLVPFIDGEHPQAIAHRGGAFGGLENSMEAFGRCVALGYRYLETDVHLSRDGEVVAFHDQDLTRVTDRSGRIADLSWAQISAAKIGGSGTIPRLDDLLEQFPDTYFNIDAKTPAVVLPLAVVLRRHKALNRVCLASFSDSRLSRLRMMLGPKVATALGPQEIGLLRLASYTGASPKIAGICAQIPLKIGGRVLADSRFVNTAHRLGKQVQVWTVDDPDQMRQLLHLGVDGIMTDRPEELKRVLVAQGRWRGKRTDD